MAIDPNVKVNRRGFLKGAAAGAAALAVPGVAPGDAAAQVPNRGGAVFTPEQAALRAIPPPPAVTTIPQLNRK